MSTEVHSLFLSATHSFKIPLFKCEEPTHSGVPSRYSNMMSLQRIIHTFEYMLLILDNTEDDITGSHDGEYEGNMLFGWELLP
jgi:hypothetical protein